MPEVAPVSDTDRDDFLPWGRADEVADHDYLHGHLTRQLPPPPGCCPRHGTYQFTSLLDADCPTCDLEDLNARARRHIDHHHWTH